MRVLAAVILAGLFWAGAVPAAAQLVLSDTLRCEFEPTHDICVANEIRRLLPEVGEDRSDPHWTFWYLTQLELRPPGLAPAVEVVIERISAADFDSAVAAARSAFDGDFVAARTGASGIRTPTAAMFAILSVAEMAIRRGENAAALALLGVGSFIAEGSFRGLTLVRFAEELAWRQARAGDPDAARNTVERALDAAGDLQGASAALAKLTLAGAVCLASGTDAGLELLAEGTAAMNEADDTGRFLSAIAPALAGRGYGRCGDRQAAARRVQEALEAARGLSVMQKISLLESMYGGWPSEQ